METNDALPEHVPGTGEAHGYLMPEDALERLERLVGILSEPLVAFTAELAGERDAALERARVAEQRSSRLIKALQRLVEAYPATSWGHSNDALEQASSALREMSEEGATMADNTPQHDGARPHGQSHHQDPADPDPRG